MSLFDLLSHGRCDHVCAMYQRVSLRLACAVVSCLPSCDSCFRSQIKSAFSNLIIGVRVECTCVTSDKVSDLKGDLVLRDLSGGHRPLFPQEPIGRCGERQAPLDTRGVDGCDFRLKARIMGPRIWAALILFLFRHYT